MANKYVGKSVWLSSGNIYTAPQSDEIIGYDAKIKGRKVSVESCARGYAHPYFVCGVDFQGWADEETLEEVRWKAKV